MVGTFALTYLMWGAIIVFNSYGYLKVGTVGFWILYPIGGLSSTLLGAYLSKKSNTVSNYKALIKEIFHIKQSLKHYMLVLALFGVYFALPFLSGISENKTSWYWGLLFVFQMIFFGGLEEIGWRYTFQPALERHISFWLASIITGCLWALWHLPLFFISGMNEGMNFYLFAFGVLSMSFMLGAIYRISNSLWLCVLFHAMINAFSQVWGSNGNLVDTLSITVIIATLTIAMVRFGRNRFKPRIK